MCGKVTFMQPHIFHYGFSIENKQGGMQMTLPPMASRAARGRTCADSPSSLARPGGAR
jgi:hypothetical protein